MSSKPVPWDSFDERWGNAIGERGFVAIPKDLLRRYPALGMDRTDLAVVIALLLHWWHLDNPVWPTLETLSSLSGVSEATVIRSLKKLGDLGLVASRRDGRRTWRDLRGLATRLDSLVRRDANHLHGDSDRPHDHLHGEGLSRRRKETQEVDAKLPKLPPLTAKRCVSPDENAARKGRAT